MTLGNQRYWYAVFEYPVSTQPVGRRRSAFSAVRSRRSPQGGGHERSWVPRRPVDHNDLCEQAREQYPDQPPDASLNRHTKELLSS